MCGAIELVCQCIRLPDGQKKKGDRCDNDNDAILSSSIRQTNRPLSRRLDRCDRVIQDESGDSNGGNV